LVVTGLTANSKTYDATTAAGLGGTAAINVLSGDAVTVGGTASGTFANKNVGTAKAVTVTGNILSGADADNYSLVQQSGLTADITPANLVVTGLTANSKTYDATTAAGLGGTAAINALPGDTVILGGTASGTFANKNVGTAKAVTVTGNTIRGADAGNYTLVQQSGLTADIDKANATVTGNSDSVTYNGQNHSVSGFTVSGLVNGELTTVLTGVSAAGSGTNAGSYDVVPVGTDSNYRLTLTNGKLTIAKVDLTVSANDERKAYDGLRYSGGNGVTYAGFITGETSNVLGGTLGYAGSSQGALDAGSYAITPAGLNSVNYRLRFIDGLLSISAPPPVAPAVVLPPLPSPSANPPPLGTASSDGPSGASVSLSQNGRVTSGNGISIPLPTQLASAATGSNAVISVTTVNGGVLPAWLKFNPETKTFVATAVPDGALPMQVMVTINGQRTTVVISNHAEE
ncbi:MAG: hypothetical protein HXX19_09135, partial [Rhodoferax sp.]|nr:hypothetical protein [Rhodoferax sp.]